MSAIVLAWLAIGMVSAPAAIAEEVEDGYMPMHELTLACIGAILMGPAIYPLVCWTLKK